jgi:hypothetical protein
MRTTVDLDPTLLEQVRMEAARRGTSVKALLNSLIRAGLAARSAEPVSAYRVPTLSLGAPRLHLDQALRVADALEDDEHLRDLHLRK